MNEKDVTESLKQAKENSKKRNFTQTYDMIINLKNLDLKKPENHLDFYLTLHYSRGKKSRICALVGTELLDDAKKVCDNVIHSDEFEEYSKDKKKAKKLAQDYDFFIAQANIMPQVASTFGKIFGPRGKMPNPKAGCVVPPKTNLKPLYEKLQDTVRIQVKDKMMIQCAVGNESMEDKEIADNIINVYNNTMHSLPLEKNNIKSVFLKLTMGKPVPVKF
ncbi:MAG: 50S ribosomal protein L1 [Candidatus Woesearchaeota archaeon]